jgi:hypothetical protein
MLVWVFDLRKLIPLIPGKAAALTAWHRQNQEKVEEFLATPAIKQIK